MRKFRNVLSLSLIIVFFLTSAVPSSAIGDDGSSRIVVKPAGEGASYESHVILNASRGGPEGSGVSYTVNSDYQNALNRVVPAGNQDDIPGYITGLSGNDLQEFADRLYKEIRSEGIPAYGTAGASQGEADLGGTPPGYILIGQTAAAAGEIYSTVMLDTTYDDETVYVTPKTETPTVEKKVLEKNDSSGGEGIWQDAADYDAGDTVSFRISAVLPGNIRSYEKYTVRLHDNLSSAFTYSNDAVIYSVNNGEKKNVTDVFSIQKDGTNLTFSCDNILLNENLSSADSLVVEYSAVLSDAAVQGNTGNPNTVYMEYSRNPHGDETGQTPADKVTVFTYQVKISKVDEQQQPLYGALFGLYKYLESGSDYRLVDQIKYGSTEFIFKGLDSGRYRLVEEFAPDGYNKIAPIEFTIEAAYDAESADPALTALTARNMSGEVISGEGGIFAADLNDGSLSARIVNKVGKELPGTGGQGTLLIYLIGILSSAAGILLFYLKKKRGKTTEK